MLLIIFFMLYFDEPQFLTEINTAQLFIIGIFAFIFGFVIAILLRYIHQRTDYNISSLPLLIFFILLELYSPETVLASLLMSTILTSLAITLFISITIGLIIYSIINK